MFLIYTIKFQCLKHEIVSNSDAQVLIKFIISNYDNNIVIYLPKGHIARALSGPMLRD